MFTPILSNQDIMACGAMEVKFRPFETVLFSGIVSVDRLGGSEDEVGHSPRPEVRGHLCSRPYRRHYDVVIRNLGDFNVISDVRSLGILRSFDHSGSFMFCFPFHISRIKAEHVMENSYVHSM
jgi:hypothetical protein